MRIVQINAVYRVGSTGRTTQELHEALIAEGIDSYVFAPLGDGDSKVQSIGNRLDWKIHGLLSRLFGLQGFFSIRSTKKLVKQLSEIKPDIVHLRNLHGNFISLPILFRYLKTNHIKVVVSLHDCWFFTGRCCHYLSKNCEKWKTECNKCPSMREWNNSWFFDTSKYYYMKKKEWFAEMDDLTVIGVSDWVLNESRQSLLRNAKRFRRIYDWVNIADFTPVYNNTSKNIVLSVAAGWSRNKGLYDILEVARLNPDLRFRMVGDMPRGIQLPVNVEAIGTICDISRLVSEYQQAAVLLHLSHQETFGKVIVEAMACGTPAVVNNATAMPELVDTSCGVVVDCTDANEVSQAIYQALSLDRRKCREHVESLFDKNDLIRRQIALYKEIMEG